MVSKKEGVIFKDDLKDGVTNECDALELNKHLMGESEMKSVPSITCFWVSASLLLTVLTLP